ncbi:bone morphogenetic protein 1-like [Microplitis demolitor]|uniref:bone morphogenetic protein 1-like n=1 Tax=Microplitis demolitor TaxID=69319 RepID=UPI0004CCA193|nr:bone morphogenetic protein 1-like [Microplitis demolitor]
MADNCMSLGSLLHELGHTIGFFHEHTRPDRDDYVEVIRDNIMTGEEHNFDKASKDESTTLGQAYDYSSIMHYSSNGSSKRRHLNVLQPLMKINGKLPILGQRNGLSRGDIMAANLLYHCQQCGGTLFEPEGIFSSLIQGGTSDIKLGVEHCQWTIRAPEGHRIKLLIKSLNNRESFDCSTNYLEVLNGYGKNKVVIAHYCGKYETTLTVNSNIVQILSARTQVEYDEPTFIIEYEAVCSNDIYIEYNDTFYFESPNYPEQYGPNKLCYWYITAPEDHFISITFYHFELQDSPGCISDVLEVREGDNFQAPNSRIYCGKIDNLEISSMGRLMLLKFVTDESNNGNGFSAVITGRPKNDHN